MGLPEDIVQGLAKVVISGNDENTVVFVFLYALTKRKRFNKAMSKQLRRFIIKKYKQLPKFDETIIADIEAVF